MGMVELPDGGCATEGKALTALEEEAKKWGISYGHLVANTTERERREIIRVYCAEKRRKARRSGKLSYGY